MSFKSIIEDLKGEFESISSKAFGSKSKSQPVIHHTSVATIDDSNQSCWANMPPELLTDVLKRVEASACRWPHRRNVIACAGVCRSWRKNMKEIVQNPEISGMLTFPISLKQPGPRGRPQLQCKIERDRRDQTYRVYVDRVSTVDGKLLFAAKRCRRPTCTDYIISLHPEDITKESSTYVGKLRSNFLGTKFKVYDAQLAKPAPLATKFHFSRLGSMRRLSPKVPAIDNYLVSSISYDVNVLGSRAPRQMQCVMNKIPANAIEPGGVAPTPTEFPLRNISSFSSRALFRSKSAQMDDPQLASFSAKEDPMLVLKNKGPLWSAQLEWWCLNFDGRVRFPSVKNFQLVARLENENGVEEHKTVILQFGKVSKDNFIMDYSYPLSAFQAFAICLSSFETRIACE